MAIAACVNAISGGGTLMADIINHKLRHLLGLGAGHEEGTFMRAVVDTPNDTVTPAQQATLKATAYELGGVLMAQPTALSSRRLSPTHCQ